MSGSTRHVINMANSIIGVSILSMPYCFKEAGLMLGILLILLSGFITKKTCMFLIKSAIMSRRRSYELLAFHVFGVAGKLLMELCMILFLMGICVSFHVVIGDLAPAMFAKYLDIENSHSLRCTLLVGMVLLVILPLCLLRNLDSLASMSACSIGFYVFLNGVIFAAASSRLLDGSWVDNAQMFHFENVFKVLPIMMLALACQSNVFEIYYSIPDPSVEKMKTVVSQAVNLSCALYIGVGFLGYVTFIDRDIGGNVILSFPYSNMTDGITIVFVFTLAISFPLILFPCRTSIHSLLYRRNIAQGSYDIALNFIPESRFKIITFAVLFISMLIGILLPSIEFVLGLLGSTMGMLIALIFPSIFFIKVYTKQSVDRLLAQGLLLIGIIFMVTGTYLHLSGMQSNHNPVAVNSLASVQASESVLKVIPNDVSDLVKDTILRESDTGNIDATGRKEPAIPEPPLNDDRLTNELDVMNNKNENINLKTSLEANISKPVIKKLPSDAKIGGKIHVDDGAKSDIINKRPDVEKMEDSHSKIKVPEDEYNIPVIAPKSLKKEETLHPDAIKKEDKENAEEIMQDKKPLDVEIENKQEKILKQLEHQQHEQKQLIEEQKKILQELKNHKEKIEEIEIEKHIVGNINEGLPLLSKNDINVKEKVPIIPISNYDLNMKSNQGHSSDSAVKFESSKSNITLRKRTLNNSHNKSDVVAVIDSGRQINLSDKEKLKAEHINVVSPKEIGLHKNENTSKDTSKLKIVVKPNTDLLKSFVLQNRSKVGLAKSSISLSNDHAALAKNMEEEEPAPHDEERRKRDLSAVVKTNSKYFSSDVDRLVSSENNNMISSNSSIAPLIFPKNVVPTNVSLKILNQPDLLKLQLEHNTSADVVNPVEKTRQTQEYKREVSEAESTNMIKESKYNLKDEAIIPLIVNSDKLSLDQEGKIPILGLSDIDKVNIETKIKHNFRKTEVDNVVYDTRHLLWSSRSNAKVNLGRRRKKRNKQYPDYFDEM